MSNPTGFFASILRNVSFGSAEALLRHLEKNDIHSIRSNDSIIAIRKCFEEPPLLVRYPFKDCHSVADIRRY